MACTNDLKEIEAQFGEVDPSYEVADSVTIQYSDSGYVNVLIRTPKIYSRHYGSEPEEIFPRGVDVTFFDHTQRATSWLTSKYGRRDLRDNLIYLQDDVLLYNIGGDTLFSNQLIWDQDKNEVYTDHFVRISTPIETIYSHGFKADEQFTRYTLRKAKGKISERRLE